MSSEDFQIQEQQQLIFDEQEKIQDKYMGFYDHYQIVDSQQKSFDFENLNFQVFRDCIRVQGNYQMGWRQHKHYLCHYGYDFNMRATSRYAQIPTVYLVTQIQTQHIQSRKHWQIDNNSQQETNGQENKDNEEFIKNSTKQQMRNIQKGGRGCSGQLGGFLGKGFGVKEDRRDDRYCDGEKLVKEKVVKGKVRSKTQRILLRNEKNLEKQHVEQKIMYRSTYYYKNQKKNQINNSPLVTDYLNFIQKDHLNLIKYQEIQNRGIMRTTKNQKNIEEDHIKNKIDKSIEIISQCLMKNVENQRLELNCLKTMDFHKELLVKKNIRIQQNITKKRQRTCNMQEYQNSINKQVCKNETIVNVKDHSLCKYLQADDDQKKGNKDIEQE